MDRGEENGEVSEGEVEEVRHLLHRVRAVRDDQVGELRPRAEPVGDRRVSASQRLLLIVVRSREEPA